MRDFCVSIIKGAAVASGLPETRVIDKPDEDSLLLPKPRIELEYMPENLTRSVKKIAKFPKPGAETRYKVLRTKIYDRELTIRATVVTKTPEELEPLVLGLLTAMPHTAGDFDNNLLTVKASRAVRAGFGHQLVTGLPTDRFENALHLVFAGMICRDTEIPLIRNLHIKDGIQIA